MAETPETAGRILRSWMAIEVLTPQVTKDGWNGLAAEKRGQQRNNGDLAPDHPGQQDVPENRTATPWPSLAAELPLDDESGETSTDPAAAPTEPRSWYSVVLGALPARQAFKHLDAAFSDEVDEDERWILLEVRLRSPINALASKDLAMGLSYEHLSLNVRHQIFRLSEASLPIWGNAEQLGRHRPSIHRELRRRRFEDVPSLRNYFRSRRTG